MLGNAGKLVNANDCHNILSNKRLGILQNMSSLKQEEERILNSIKECQSSVQTKAGEVSMLRNELTVVNSSAEAQTRLCQRNEEQIVNNPLDENIEEEINHLKIEISETDLALQQLQNEIDSDSNPELLEVLKKIQRAQADQVRVCNDIAEAKARINDLSQDLEHKRTIRSEEEERLNKLNEEENVGSDEVSKSKVRVKSLTKERGNIEDNLQQKITTLNSLSVSDASLKSLQSDLEKKKISLQATEKALSESKTEKKCTDTDKKTKQSSRRESLIASEVKKRVASKKRALREIQESDLEIKQNTLEVTGEQYSKEEKKREQVYLNEKRQLENEYNRLTRKLDTKRQL